MAEDTHHEWFHELQQLLDGTHQDMKEVKNTNIQWKGKHRNQWKVLKKITKAEKGQD